MTLQPPDTQSGHQFCPLIALGWANPWVLSQTKHTNAFKMFRILLRMSTSSHCRDKLRTEAGFNTSIYKATPINIFGCFHFSKYPFNFSRSILLTKVSRAVGMKTKPIRPLCAKAAKHKLGLASYKVKGQKPIRPWPYRPVVAPMALVSLIRVERWAIYAPYRSSTRCRALRLCEIHQVPLVNHTLLWGFLQ